MGSGKSVVGRALAITLGRPFYDTDLLIEGKTGKRIAEIFRQKGEAFFRSEETRCLTALQSVPPGVIALGGGMILSYENRQILQREIWFNLRVSPAAVVARIGSRLGRPLLKKGVKREDIERLANQRRPFYDLAPNQIETDGLAPEAVAETIAKKIQRGRFR